MKKRIAIWIHGGIGSGLAAQGQPPIMRLVEQLSLIYDLHVFSQSPPVQGFKPTTYRIISTSPSVRNGTLRWLGLIWTFFRSHLGKEYQCLYAFWGYPAGVIAYFISRIIRKPSIIHLQGGDCIFIEAFNYGVLNNRYRKAICRYVYRHCTTLIALTNYQKQFLTQLGVTRNVNIIPYGVDENIFPFQPRSLDARKTISFLMVGNLTPIKNQEMALRTFKLVLEHRKCELTIVGPDYGDGDTQRMAEYLGIGYAVKFVPHQLHRDLPFFYRNADVLLHTSYYEGQGVVFAEGASCGTLLAGTRVGMLADMGDSCGLIVEHDDAESLASHLITILSSPAQYQQCLHHAKAWIMERNEAYTLRGIRHLIDKA